MPQATARLRVAQVSVYRDPEQRAPIQLLRAWRDYGACAAAAQRAGADMTVVQASWTDKVLDVGGVPCHFVQLPALWRRIADANPQVIHWQGLLFPKELRELTRRFPAVPVIAQDHGSSVPPAFWRRWSLRRGAGRLAGVMFTAREQAVA